MRIYRSSGGRVRVYWSAAKGPETCYRTRQREHQAVEETLWGRHYRPHQRHRRAICGTHPRTSRCRLMLLWFLMIFDMSWCSMLESRKRAVVGKYREKCCQRCCDSHCTILYGARRLGGHWKWRSHRANQAPRAENSRQDERWKIPWRTRRKEILCDDGTGLSIINLLQGWHEQISCEFRFLHKPDILWSAGVEPWPEGTFQHTRSDDALICFELTLKSFQRSNQHRPG